MKKILLFVALLAIGVDALWAQGWDYQLSVAPTFSRVNYRVSNGSLQHPFSAGFGLEYRSKVNNKKVSYLDSWGVGLSYSNLKSMWGMPSNTVAIPQSNRDVVFCDFSNFTESQTATFLSVTPMFFLKIASEDGFVLGIGPSLGLLRGKWSNYGQMTTSLQDAMTGVVLREDIGGYGLGTFTETATGNYSKFVLGGSIEAGYSVHDIYLGLYGKVCTIQGIKGDNPIITGVGESITQDISYHGIIQSTILQGGNIVELGVKLAYRFGGKPAQTDQSALNDGLNRNLEKENKDLKKKNQIYQSREDSLMAQIRLGLDSNNIRRVDVLVRDYARLCLAAPYDKAKYDNYKELFGLDGFATTYYKKRCKGYLELLGQYEKIEIGYNKILKDFGVVYKSTERMERITEVKAVYQKLLNYQKDWNEKISAIEGMNGLEDVPYINNQLKNCLKKMKAWIAGSSFPPAWEYIKYELRIEEEI